MLRWLCNPRRNQVAPVSSSMIADRNYIVIQRYFLRKISQEKIEERSGNIATEIIEELQKTKGVYLYTSNERPLRSAVVTFRPANLEPAKVVKALEEDGIVAANLGGKDWAGVRFSPHFYNSNNDVERAVGAIRRYVQKGL